MGFTFSAIGGMRETRPPRTGTRRRGRSAPTAVAEYTGLWGWSVLPGAHLSGAGCSCGDAGCPRPGDHPLAGVAEVPAGATLAEAAAAWSSTPDAAVLLPVGTAFDVVEAAEPAARRAVARLERMGAPVGPVALTPTGRAAFLVAPGGAAELPGLLYRTGWDDVGLDVRGLGPGDHLTAPPSDLGPHGAVTWLRAPGPDRAGPPPHPRLLLGTLAYVSRR